MDDSSYMADAPWRGGDPNGPFDPEPPEYDQSEDVPMTDLDKLREEVGYVAEHTTPVEYRTRLAINYRALIAALEREVEALKVCGSCRYCAWDQSVGHPYCTAHQNWFVQIAYPCRIEWFRGESRWTRREP